MNNSFLDKFTKWGQGKNLEREGDPLHNWHKGGKQESDSLAENEDGLILSEEESHALEQKKQGLV